MQKKDWRRVESIAGPDLKLFKARFDLMQNPRNGSLEKMIILEANDSANIVAVTPKDEILFARQYRFGIEAYTLELPGGIVDDGESHQVAARRELAEETGYVGDHWTYLGSIPSNPVFMDSYIHHWCVTDVQPQQVLKLDDGEDIHVELLPKEEVYDKLYDGFFMHPHTVNALVRYFGSP